MAGLRVYLLDSYNWIDFIVLSLYLASSWSLSYSLIPRFYLCASHHLIVLSLYLASYVLRLLVDHRVHQADLFYNCITARSRDALAARDFRLYDVIVNETFGNRSSSIHNYFMKACKTFAGHTCYYQMCAYVIKYADLMCCRLRWLTLRGVSMHTWRSINSNRQHS